MDMFAIPGGLLLLLQLQGTAGTQALGRGGSIISWPSMG